MKRHMAAAKIQRAVRHYLSKRPRKMRHDEEEIVEKQPFTGINFILCGKVPAMTQDAMKKIIKENGGRVRSTLPDGKGKGASTKKYTILCTQTRLDAGKVPECITTSLKKKHDILSYSFIHDAIANKVCDSERFSLNTERQSAKITPDITIEEKHFSKKTTMLTKLRQLHRKKAQTKRKSKIITSKYTSVGRTPAHYFVISKMKIILAQRSEKGLPKLHLPAQNDINSKHFKEWKNMPEEKKERWRRKWREKIDENEKKIQTVKEDKSILETYNRIKNLSYLNYLDFS
jgi:hypothetical protein